jgi:hypothetical protein
MATIEVLARDAAWVPNAYFAAQDAFSFVYLPRAEQQRAVFLDSRYTKAAPAAPPVSAASLRPLIERQPPAFSHYIFHTAFCCSTLLARALDVPGASMGLKEPSVLVSFSSLASARTETPASKDALGLALALLARPLSPGERQIVKASNVNNLLIPAIMGARPESKAIFLHGGLDAFLRSIAKKNLFGRAFARRLYRHFSPLLALNTGFSAADIFDLTDLQIAALVWLMQARQLSALAAHYGPDRVRLLDSETLLADPTGTLTHVGNFFDLVVDADRWAKVAAGPVFRTDAKDHGQPFDADRRRREQQSVEAAFAEEVRTATQWARAVAAHAGAPTELGDTLRD